MGLLIGSFVALLIFWLSSGQGEAIAQPIYSLYFRPSVKKISISLAFWLFIGFTFWLNLDSTGGLIFLLVLVVIGLLYEAFIKSRVIIRAVYPDAGLVCTWQSFLVHMLFVGLIYGLMIGSYGEWIFGLICGLIFGLMIGLNRGGWFVILQLWARHKAVKQGLLPKDMIEFLKLMSSSEYRLLRQVGGGFQFRHRELLDYLKHEAPKPGLEAIRAMSD